MKQKKRSPEAIYEEKSARRSEIDGLRKARWRGRPEERAAATEALRQIDGKWPVGLFEALNGPYDDGRSLDILLRFLADDPYFERSGYVKEIALRRLGKWPLAASDRQRIALIVIGAADGPTGREFRRQCAVARHADRSILVPELAKRLDNPDPAKAWRACCVARGMLGLRWLTRYDRVDPLVEIESMRERLRALPEAR